MYVCVCVCVYVIYTNGNETCEAFVLHVWPEYAYSVVKKFQEFGE